MQALFGRPETPQGGAPCGASAGLVAITGGTGFVGRHVAAALAARGFRLRILARQPAVPLWHGLDPEWVAGDLENEAALATLAEGADVVVHLAGLVKARSRREFQAVNRDGAARLAAAVQRAAPAAHLIGISSLAARMPQLSPYAESKRAGEAALIGAFRGRLTIIRPPVVYGPWDRATLGIFRAAALPVVPVPGFAEGRIAMIHVAEAAGAIAAHAARIEAPDGVYALADPNPGGYAPREILEIAAAALGRIPHFVRLPAAAVRLAGQAAGLAARARGRPAMFSAGKAREMLYPDWGVAPGELLPGATGVAGIDLRRGFASTVAWYRQAGWLA